MRRTDFIIGLGIVAPFALVPKIADAITYPFDRGSVHIRVLSNNKLYLFHTKPFPYCPYSHTGGPIIPGDAYADAVLGNGRGIIKSICGGGYLVVFKALLPPGDYDYQNKMPKSWSGGIYELNSPRIYEDARACVN